MNLKSANKHFDTTIKEVIKKLGQESVLLLNQNKWAEVEVYPSGSLILDEICGIMGFPKGRIIEIFGSESSGKTTIALTTISQIQKNGGLCAYIDAEHSIDLEYASKVGVNIDTLILSQPTTGEEAFEMCETLAKTGNIDLIVVDSVAALVPEAELNGEVRDQSIGLQARLMSKALRKLTGILNKTKTTLIFINQIREKVGVIFGSPETTPGGRALKFYSSIRLEVRKGAQISTGGEIVGNQIKVKVVKNKLAPPYKTGVMHIYFSKGIDRNFDLLTVAEKHKVLELNKGGWYIFEGKHVVKGRLNMTHTLRNTPALFEKISELTRTKILEKAKSELKTSLSSSSETDESVSEPPTFESTPTN